MEKKRKRNSEIDSKFNSIRNLSICNKKRFMEQNAKTGIDSLSLPPSGVTYSYPGMMNEAAQEKFVEKVEIASSLMNTSTVYDIIEHIK